LQNFVKFTFSGGSHPEMVQHVGGFMRYSYTEHSSVQLLKKCRG